MNENIFRAYDIRGIYGDTLNDDIAYQVGLAVGSAARAAGEQEIAVGRDGRLSGPALTGRLIDGLRAAGCDVVDVGMVPTPVLYFAANTLAGVRSGVMVTGSHNPGNYNGFKIMIAGETLSGEQIQQLKHRILNEDVIKDGQGSLRQHDVLPAYLDNVVAGHPLARPMKVVIDSGNGIAGVIAPALFRALGCEVISLFEEVDGHFPNHHPDPGEPENLQDVIRAVAEHGADLGVAFDGDADRVGIVLNDGRIVYPDVLLMALAEDVLARHPGAGVIFDVKCTSSLYGVIEQAGGRPEMWKTGHSLIKQRMKDSGALLAGEMSGHIFFAENWYGFDDAMVAAARLLGLLSRQSATAADYFQRFPVLVTTPEESVTVTEETKFPIVAALQQQAGRFKGARVTTLDGLRVDFPDGWGLCRASNTSPKLVMRFEGKDEDSLARIKGEFMALIEQAMSSVADKHAVSGS